jgi:hypothetical protein
MTEFPLPRTAYDIVFTGDGSSGGGGYAFGRPPGIDPACWPRSRVNALPMAHLFTVRVPEQYRCAGPEFVALSIFQADDHVAKIVDGLAALIDGGPLPEHDAATSAFWAEAAAYARRRHSMERYAEDLIRGGWALLWLTEEEFAGPPAELPAAAAVFPGHESDGKHGNAYLADRPARALELVLRADDPYVGRPPIETEDYQYIHDTNDERRRLGLPEFHECHFGGTADYVNGGLYDTGAWYLQFDGRLGDGNLGGDGSAAIDLMTSRIDWSCG